MYRLVFFILLIFTLSNCENNSIQNSSSDKEHIDFLSDKLFEYKNFKGTIKDVWMNSELSNKYLPIDSQATLLLLNHEQSPIRFPYYGARYVAKQNKIGNVQPIIIYVSSDDYSSYILVTLNENKRPIDITEIAGGWWNDPHEISDSIGECGGDSYFNIIDNHNIEKVETRYLFKCYTDSDGVFNMTENDLGVDSLYYKVKISNSGKITTTLIDSVRIVKSSSKQAKE